MDINTATLDDLKGLFQGDVESAKRLFQKRQELGGFKNWDQVKQIPGINERVVQVLQMAGATIGGGQSEQKVKPPWGTSS